MPLLKLKEEATVERTDDGSSAEKPSANKKKGKFLKIFPKP